MIQIALIAAFSLRLLWRFAIINEVAPSELTKTGLKYFSVYCHQAGPLTLVALVVFYFSGFYTYGRFYQGRYKALIVG
ncbi:MAG: hypothetical protein IIA67_11645, partial [Planctomycetes bacterium]|nr:hypothetical protein [Planctomycetota bacterium]